MESIKGYIDHIIFRNEDNGYTVFVLVYEEEELTCVGSFPVVSQGENVELKGEFIEHPMYGRQFWIGIWAPRRIRASTQPYRPGLSGSLKRIPSALLRKSRSGFRK